LFGLLLEEVVVSSLFAELHQVKAGKPLSSF
jgi:hypothetical protein